MPNLEYVKQEMADEIGYTCPDVYNASRLLFDNLKRGRGSKVAVYSDAGNRTFEQLAKEANQVGNMLLQFGMKPGERILLFLDDEPAYLAAIMGSMKVGCVPILTNTLSTEDAIRYMLTDSEAKAAIVSEDFQDIFVESLLAETSCTNVIVAGEATDNRIAWADVKKSSADLDEILTSKNDMSLWMYSSGTTGRPKGVVHRHEDLLYANTAFAENILKLTPEDICYSIPKIFFAYGFGNSVVFPMAVGASVVLATGRPEPGRIFDQISKHHPTVLFGLPTAFNALINHDGSQTADLSSIRLCLSAAEVLSKNIFDSWRDRFGQEIVEGLGSTEMLHIYLSNTESEKKLGSAGKRVPGYAIRLLDESGAEVPDGEEGVMEVSGISGAVTYWNRPDKTKETIRGEWLWTGDRFIRDSDGFYFFKGRADDLVKVSGQWLWPHEIEMALAEHPEVKECAVLAEEMADARMTVVAYVVPNSPDKVGDDFSLDLKNFVKKSLLPHKYPRQIHYLKELPKTGTQKVDRQALKSATA
jgi:benzoate-CoA ligase family protein